jgi:hypothetical protein
VTNAQISRGPVLSWIDGLIGWEEQRTVLERVEHVQVLHGHVHRSMERPLRGYSLGILGAPAVVDEGPEPALRLYDVTPDGLAPVRRADSAAPKRGHRRVKAEPDAMSLPPRQNKM